MVAVPLERAEFLADLARGTDFLMQFAAQQRTRDVDILWRLYEASAALIRHGIARASRRGVLVWTRSTATDFTRCLRQHLVVTLVAHWRTARFRARDILDPQGVHRLLPDADDRADAPVTAETMAAALNRKVDAASKPVASLAIRDTRNAATETGRQYAMWRARRGLEEFLGSAVRAGGPAVEFTEGLVTVERVVAAVPESFARVLDLTICNSALLAEEVRRRHPRGLVVANAFPASLQTRMEFYNDAVDLMAWRGVTYQDAMFRIRRELRRQP